MKRTSTGMLAAMVAMSAVAVGLTAVAQADPPPFNGTYTGGDDYNIWTVATSCATDGCTGTVASNQGWKVPATMTGGLWNFMVTKPDGIICDDGSYAPAYISLSVDPATLSGTITTDSNYSCPGGLISRTPFQLKKIG